MLALGGRSGSTDLAHSVVVISVEMSSARSGVIPISDTINLPTFSQPGNPNNPVLGYPRVIVASEMRHAGSIEPVSASSPEGTSRATIIICGRFCLVERTVSMMSLIGPWNARSLPVPKSESITTSAEDRISCRTDSSRSVSA